MAALALAPGASASCASLRHVKAFKGHVTEKVGAVASGDYPQSEGGGTQTIQLGRAVVGADMHLGDKFHSPTGDYTFKGRVSGGKAVISDSFDDTGTDHYGELKYNGPLKNGGANASGGIVGLDRKECRYKLAVSFSMLAQYQGDPAVNFGRLATFGAFSETKHIPDDLKLGGDAQVEPRPDFLDGDPETVKKAQITLNSAWMPDLITLFECDSPHPVGGCLDDENPAFDTPASISWHLHPVFKK